MNNSTILCFHLAKDKEKAVADVCHKLNIRLRKVSTSEYNQQLGFLAGIQGFSRKQTKNGSVDLAGEMIVFSGMDSDCVDAFLAAYKETGAAPIGLKAILTPHNVFWDVSQLYGELMKEHKMFQ